MFSYYEGRAWDALASPSNAHTGPRSPFPAVLGLFRLVRVSHLPSGARPRAVRGTLSRHLATHTPVLDHRFRSYWVYSAWYASPIYLRERDQG
ncbi:hypothetical protein NDU88_012485 [Pleurodeles waltl]|uniref:Uncharacterized protein n=1 Tax=Pleurodeles waltl TaxID=8319 RepID=A0AAV7R1S1_PLEWA|nr:hypothetical protein NDU88_012485 [Pleurodeles waltl]